MNRNNLIWILSFSILFFSASFLIDFPTRLHSVLIAVCALMVFVTFDFCKISAEEKQTIRTIRTLTNRLKDASFESNNVELTLLFQNMSVSAHDQIAFANAIENFVSRKLRAIASVKLTENLSTLNRWTVVFDWALQFRRTMRLTTHQFLILIGVESTAFNRVYLYPESRKIGPVMTERDIQMLYVLERAYASFNCAPTAVEIASDKYEMNRTELSKCGIRACWFNVEADGRLTALCDIDSDASKDTARNALQNAIEMQFDVSFEEMQDC